MTTENSNTSTAKSASRGGRKTSPKKSEMATLELAERMHISNLHELHQQCAELLSKKVDVNIQAAHVERVDAASLQLMGSFVSALQKQNTKCVWDHPSELFQQAAADSGLTAWLSLP